MAKAAKKKTSGKTTSKPAKAKSNKSVAKKTTKKSVAKKAVPSKINKEITTDRLRKFNFLAAFANLVFAVLSVIFISKDTVIASLQYAAKDEFASTSVSVFGPAYKTICEFEIRYVLAFIFGLSAIFSLLLATRLRKKYETQLSNSVSAIRWIFSGITLGLILELSAKLTNVDNLVILKTIVALTVVTAILWIISEQQNKGTKGKSSVFYLSLFTLLLAVAPVLVALGASGIYGTERFGWHVYAFAFVIIAGLITLAVNQYNLVKYGTSAKGYLELEGRYLSIDFLVKFAAFIILLTALYK